MAYHYPLYIKYKLLLKPKHVLMWQAACESSGMVCAPVVTENVKSKAMSKALINLFGNLETMLPMGRKIHLTFLDFL